MKVLHLLLLFALFAVLYMVYIVFAAWWEVRRSPREPMFMCDRHGPIRKEHLIHFQSSPKTWVDYCPICFHERLASVEKVK